MVVCVFFGTFARTDMPGGIVGGTSFTACFPFFADIEGAKWLIAGDGGMTLREMRDLPPCGAVIGVVPPDMCPGLDALAQGNAYMGVLKLTRKEFGNRDLDGVDFVIAATSEPSLNGGISALCRSKRIPVNVVDVKEEYSFIPPSIVQDGPVVVGISTDGMSPVIARCPKARIQSTTPDSLGDLTARLGSCRKTIKNLFPDSPQVRSALFCKLARERFSRNGCLTQKQV